MIQELKLRKIGESLGVTFGAGMLAHLKVGEGDTLCLTEVPDGSLRITAANPDFARKMAAAESLSSRYRNALRELAR